MATSHQPTAYSPGVQYNIITPPGELPLAIRARGVLMLMAVPIFGYLASQIFYGASASVAIVSIPILLWGLISGIIYLGLVPTSLSHVTASTEELVTTKFFTQRRFPRQSGSLDVTEGKGHFRYRVRATDQDGRTAFFRVDQRGLDKLVGLGWVGSQPGTIVEALDV